MVARYSNEFKERAVARSLGPDASRVRKARVCFDPQLGRLHPQRDSMAFT